MKTKLKGFLAMSLSIFSSIQSEPFLFQAYPTLKEKIPYIALGNIGTTPVIHAKTLGAAQKITLYVKHDGVHGTDKSGNILFSGNKRRKLEFLLADALAHGARHVYAQGGAGSNFATCTAAYSHELGLACTLVLSPQRNTGYTQRNLKLDLYYGAGIVACPSRESREPLCKELAQQDPAGYLIPLGGSNSIGALGYVNAAFELKHQIEQNILPQPDLIYITVSSAGMASGLVVGLYAAALDIPVCMVRIDGTPESITQDVTKLIQETADYLHQCDDTFPIAANYSEKFSIIQDVAGEEYVAIDHAAIQRHHDMQFTTYALITPEVQEAISTFYNVTGIKLDGTYAGKAFAACLRDINTGNLANKNLLFWDSFCAGTFNEYAQTVDTSKLPMELQKYIDGTYPVQSSDQGV
jgi:1-aminocyclopropane-1-carboxylate deaminase/D-cysteine desulfhydrase-like pyridoxal-dependent ACC family enzyme